MKWRCLNDNFGYCSDKPQCDESPNVIKLEEGSDYHCFVGGTCKLDSKTCGKHQTHSDTTTGMVFPKSNYTHTVTGKKTKKGGK